MHSKQTFFIRFAVKVVQTKAMKRFLQALATGVWQCILRVCTYLMWTLEYVYLRLYLFCI